MTNITELTKEQKIAAYEYAIHEIISHNSQYFYVCRILCFYSHTFLKIDVKLTWLNASDLFKELFPEFWSQKPEYIIRENGTWWLPDDRKSRIQALQNAIKLLED